MANKKFDKIRETMMEKVGEMFGKDTDVLRTNSNELCFPIVAEDGEEGYLVLTFKIPTGSRDGDAYDGYAMAEDYKMKCAERKVKAEKAAQAKAKKIAKDEKMRAEKARLKAEREKKGE